MYPVLWAIDHAPVYDAEERAVLVALVIKGDFDGTNCFRSYPTLAAAAKVDVKTAGRKCRAMESRGVLRRQTKHQSRVWLSIPKEQRPVIWEVMIPAEWWSAAQLESINEQRAGLGRAPLTPESRPELPEAPPKKPRADKGVKRPRKASATPTPGTTSPRGKTDAEGGQVGTTSPYPPDCKSLPQGLAVPQPSESPSESPSEINQAPAARSAADARRASAGSSACAQAESGSAASGQDGSHSEGQDAAPAGVDVPKQRAEGPELTGEQVARLKAVVASLPAELVELLPYRTLPRRNRRQFLESIGGRTTEQVIERAARRWVQHGYAEALHSIDGKGIGSAVGVAVALVQAGNCVYIRCEDGFDIDTGMECRACVERRADRRAAKRAAAAAGRDTSIVRQAPHRPGWWECAICHDPGKGQIPEGGECVRCQEEAASATQRLADQWEQQNIDREAERQAVAADLVRQAEERAAAEAAENQRVAEERTAKERAEADETARIRAKLAKEYPELAAVSGSTGPAPF